MTRWGSSPHSKVPTTPTPTPTPKPRPNIKGKSSFRQKNQFSQTRLSATKPLPTLFYDGYKLQHPQSKRGAPKPRNKEVKTDHYILHLTPSSSFDVSSARNLLSLPAIQMAFLTHQYMFETLCEQLDEAQTVDEMKRFLEATFHWGVRTSDRSALQKLRICHVHPG